MRAELLLALAPVAWLLLVRVEVVRRRRRAGALGPRVRLRRRTFVLAAAALVLAVVAALAPKGDAGDDVLGNDLVVCLDVSRSMLAGDEDPDRLTHAKKMIRALAAEAKGDRLGLVLFAGEARAAVPLTEDMASFAELLDLADPTSVGRGGTDLGAALDAALEVLKGRAGTVVVFTDGEDLGGRGLEAARLLAERGVKVHCVGVGTELGSKIAAGEGFLRDRSGEDVVSALDAKGLSAIAAATGGTFGRTAPDLAAARGAGDSDRKNRYQWPLTAAVLLCAVDLARRRS